MTTCVDSLGPGYALCANEHCSDFQYTSFYNAICRCLDWQGNPIPNCDPKNSIYPVQSGQCANSDTGAIENINDRACAQLGAPWYWQTCYCCCTCFASATPVAGPDGLRALGDYVAGDQVLAAAAAGGSLCWTPQTVEFSAGSPPAAGSGSPGTIMVYVEYGDGQALIASPNQLFLTPSGQVKRADQLVPGADSLVDKEGGGVALHRLASGHYRGGIHHIATSVPSYDAWDGSLDGHLINANGIVCGDYVLQMYQDTVKMKPHLAAPDAPTLGTAAYQAAAPGLAVKPFVVGRTLALAGTEVSQPGFRAHGPSPVVIPEKATQLFTADQEKLLADPAIPKRGFSDETNVQRTDYYITLYGGFFRDVAIILDWEGQRPNVFAYTQGGQATVVISGEFLRLGPLYGEAMAIALAFGVANRHLAADANHPGRSLYDGVGVVMQQALQGRDGSMSTLIEGHQQFDALLALLMETNEAVAGAALSASCMASVIDAAMWGKPLPACAG